MAWWDELGETLPQQQQKPEVSGAGSWTDWLQNPVNQAGLLSFGLQMMSGGGHGGQSFGQELATGLSHGFAGAAATDAAIRKQQELDEEQARKEHEGAADRAQRMEIAKMQIASRDELARERIAGMLQATGMRNEAMLQRAQLPGAGKGGMTFNQARMRAEAEDKQANPMRLSNMTPEEEIAYRDRLDARAVEILQQSRGGAPAGATPAAPAPAGSPTPQPKAAAAAGQIGLEQALKKPAVAKALESEAGQAELRSRGLGYLVDEYLKRK